MILFEKLSFSYQKENAAETTVLDRLSGRFERHGVHSVIGPSGCGKTTLIYLIAGLLTPAAGTVLIDGLPVVSGREETGVILQDHGLFPWKSVSANLAIGLRLRGYEKNMIRKRVARAADEMGFSPDYLNRYPAQLSGGERQRLAIGRALVLGPDLLLLDEPFSSLDAMTRERLQDHLWHLQKKKSTTMIVVTHSIEEAVFLSDYIHIMDFSGRLHRIVNHSSGPEYRKTKDYFNHCVRVRNRLEESTGKPGRRRS